MDSQNQSLQFYILTIIRVSVANMAYQLETNRVPNGFIDVNFVLNMYLPLLLKG